MKGYKRLKSLRMGGLMKNKSVGDKCLSNSSVNQKVKTSLIKQVEQDRFSDSIIYRVRSNVAYMLRKTGKRNPQQTGSVFRAFVLVIIMALTLTQAGPLFNELSGVHAETTINRWATVTGDIVNLRASATSASTKLDSLNLNDRLYVLSQVSGQVTTMYGDQWYQVKYTKADGRSMEGYMVASLIRLDSDVPADDPYYQEFKDQGFPSSYWPALRELKVKFPNWKFTPMTISSKYSWNAIIDGQNSPGRSLLPNSWSNAYKSYSSDAFNYATDTWKPYDSGTWIMASEETIAYYLDPRNWLFEDTVFMFENLKYNSAVHTKAGVTSILSSTFMDGREKYSYVEYNNANVAGATKEGTQVDHFMEAATRSGVSPYHLAARARIEVVVANGGKSGSVTGTYVDPYNKLDLKNLYNYYNIGAVQGDYPIRNGLEYAKYGPGRKPEQTATDNKYLIPWDSPWRAIVGGSIFIGNSYINRNQHTLYLQKFDLDDAYDSVFWHQYMGNLHAPAHEARTTYRAYSAMGQLNNSFEFVIPIITGMPDAPAPLPTDARSKNPWIKTLDVSGLALNQAFNPAKTEYSLTLNHEFSSVTITASTVNAKGKVIGTGTYNLIPGTNIIKVTGVAEAGQKREYTITIIRKEADGSVPPDVQQPQDPIPTLSFSQQQIKVQNNMMTGLDPAKDLNTVEQFVSNLGVPAGYQVQVLKADGNPQTDMIGTGNIVRISYENLMSQDYKIVVFGDVNGDGRITSSDLNQTFYHVLQKSELSSIYSSAADIDRNGKVTSSDLNQIFNHVLQKSIITQ